MNILSHLIWFPLIVLSTTLLAFFLQALSTCRRIASECEAIEVFRQRMAAEIKGLAESKRGRFSIGELRERLGARFDATDPVINLLIESPGSPVQVLDCRIDSIVHRSFGGRLSSSIRTLGNLSVLIALALTSTKILMAMFQMGDADPKSTTAIIAQGLISTVGGATLAAMATLINWLVLDDPVARIHHALTTAVHRLSDTHRLNTRPTSGETLAVPASKGPEQIRSTTPQAALWQSPSPPTRRTAVMPYALAGESDPRKEETTYAHV